ncbi:unnamed protein product [Closterium sp. Naga37s-1]|nr:unnamed protein product [Closterium sp. Naga37s-1]
MGASPLVTEESDSPRQNERRKDGDEEQGDAGVEAAGREERSAAEPEPREGPRQTAQDEAPTGAEAAPAEPTAVVEEVREEAQAPAVSEGRRAEAEPALAAAEAAGEERTAAEEPAEGEEMALAAMADGGDVGDDGRADPAGGGSTAFDQAAGDTQGDGSPGKNAAHAPIRRSIRLQPSPRRLGAGLAPGLPGPLRGWECQTYQPRPHDEGPSRPYPSSTRAEEEEAGELPAEEEILQPPREREIWEITKGRKWEDWRGATAQGSATRGPDRPTCRRGSERNAPTRSDSWGREHLASGGRMGGGLPAKQ